MTGIDPRGPRLTAAVTLVLLAAALVSPEPAATVLVAVQAVFFAIGAGLGVQHTPTALVFRHVLRPRLGPPAELEDPRPPRFAQGVGLFVVGVGMILHLLGVPWALPIATSAAFIAAFLNAAFGFCLGCQIYLLLQRAGILGRPAPAA